MPEASWYVDQLSRNDKIVIYGDEDVDGVASSIIIKEALERKGFSNIKVIFCFQEEGHGFNMASLDYIEKENPRLIIMVDLGISDNEAVIAARSKGFESIIIDHHEPLSDDLPPANFIINPKQPEDDYAFKKLAAAGLCYHFALWLLKDDPDIDILNDRFVELAGLATIADMMPVEEDNLNIINRAMDVLPNTSRDSIRFLLERYSKEDIVLREVIQRLITVLNASQVNNQRMAESFLVLTENRSSEISKMVEILEKRSSEHFRLREEIILEAERRLNEENLLSDIIFIGDDNWPRRVLASVATRLASSYQRPVFVYCQGEKTSRGSARAPDGIDCVSLMSACSKYLVNFGGHPPAAGFEVKNEDLQKLHICLIKSYQKLYG